ncbi:hypothetical protein GJAV_G00089900 [Gymnothorax javanicus]|nr:hypothetical protein GJAV_G00089900 [Gymnothorax javanicus]
MVTSPHYLLRVPIILHLTDLFKSMGPVLAGPITRGLPTPCVLLCVFRRNKFQGKPTLQLAGEDEVQRWLKGFQKSSGLTWRRSRTDPDAGRGSNKYRVDLRCQHNTRESAGKVTKTPPVLPPCA